MTKPSQGASSLSTRILRSLRQNGGDVLETARTLHGQATIPQIIGAARRRNIKLLPDEKLDMALAVLTDCRRGTKRRTRHTPDEVILKALRLAEGDVLMVSHFFDGVGRPRVAALAKELPPQPARPPRTRSEVLAILNNAFAAAPATTPK